MFRTLWTKMFRTLWTKMFVKHDLAVRLVLGAQLHQLVRAVHEVLRGHDDAEDVSSDLCVHSQFSGQIQQLIAEQSKKINLFL